MLMMANRPMKAISPVASNHVCTANSDPWPRPKPANNPPIFIARRYFGLRLNSAFRPALTESSGLKFGGHASLLMLIVRAVVNA